MLSRLLRQPVCAAASTTMAKHRILRGGPLSVRHFSSGDFRGMSPVDIEKELLYLRRRVGGHYSQGRYKDALNVAVELQLKVEEEMGKDNAIYASSLVNVGLMSKLTADNERAVEAYTDALHIYERVSGKMSRNYMITLANLGAAYKAFGDASKGLDKMQLYERASEALSDVYQHSQDLLGLDHKETLMAANHLASLYRVMKRTDASEALYRKALKHCTKTHGEWDSLTATLHNNLGLLMKTLERFDGAFNHYQEALNIRSKTLGEQHPDTIVTMHNIAEMHLAKGDTAKAVAIQKEIIELAGDSEDKELVNAELGKAEGDKEIAEFVLKTSSNTDPSVQSTQLTENADDTHAKSSSDCLQQISTEYSSSVDARAEKEAENEFYSKNSWVPSATTRRGKKS